MAHVHDPLRPEYQCATCPEVLAALAQGDRMIRKLERPHWVPLWWPLPDTRAALYRGVRKFFGC